MEYRFGAFPADNGFPRCAASMKTLWWTLLAIAGLVLLIAAQTLPT